MRRHSRVINRGFHLLLAALVGLEAGAIAWQLAGGRWQLVGGLLVGAAAAVIAWRLSFAPETETGTELVGAVERQDMRGIPRWWGTMPLVVAALGAVWAWLALRG